MGRDGARAQTLGGWAVDAAAAGALTISSSGMAVSLAMLIFGGPLRSELPRATTGFLLGGAIVALALALWSGSVPAVSIVQDGPAVVMIPVAAAIAASSDLEPSSALVALALIGAATGIAMLILSRLRLSGIVRYLPSTVLAAFIAGTGWYLFKGGLDIMVDRGIGVSDLSEFFQWPLAQRWMPGVAIGLVLLLIARSPAVPPIATSLVLVIGTVTFFGIVAATSSVEQVEENGWLVGPFPDGTAVSPITPNEVRDVDWGAMAAHAPGMITVLAIAVVAMLLNLSGLEMLTKQRGDHQAELRVTGAAVLLSSPLGAPVSFIGLGDTMLARRMGVTNRIVPLIAAIAMGASGLFGPQLVALVPRIVTGGLLVAIGCDLLAKWVDQIRATTSRVDQGLGILIVIVMAVAGILEGLAFGVVVACGLFVTRYSRIDHVRRMSRGFHISRVDRTAQEAEYLSSVAQSVSVFELEGYLFFGSMVGIADQVRAACTVDPPIDAVILDFRSVTGIDATGLQTLEQLADTVSIAGAALVVSGLSVEASDALDRQRATIERHPSLDAALEVVEERQLSGYSTINIDPPAATPHELSDALLARFTNRTVAPETILVAQGDPAGPLSIVLSGHLVAKSDDAFGVTRRLRRFGSGALLGEIGFFDRSTVTATVTAVTECVIATLDRAAYDELLADEPELALELHDYILRGQASRARSITQTLQQQTI